MDILMAPTHDDVILVKIIKWFKNYRKNSNGTLTVTFKKDTPKEILNLYEKNYTLFPKRLNYTPTANYELEK
ncbi:hypothetical protein FC57_GL000132 [Lactobacillus ultunensis DSM 16047]|nr:hypothetical protein FC57_GL000132 [Lactobacillus ultunensis DSM 16047]